MPLSRLLRERPLLGVVLCALLLRLIAVAFSQGYLAHDDHFETVNIAWSWQHDGIFLEDGSLRWEGKPDFGVIRSAVYNLFLLGLMKVTALVGVPTLEAHMYFNRLIHALLSLLPVIFGYRYLREETDQRTAVIGGLILAGHFLMPFLAVRNLVEMVSADLLVPGLYYAQRATKATGKNTRFALLGGLFCGGAIMIRYQSAAAIVVVPLAMMIVARNGRDGDSTQAGAGSKWFSPALIFAGTLLVMMLLQALLDLWTHGRFWGSFANLVTHIGEPNVAGPWYRHLLLLLGVLVPPLSIVMIIGLLHKRVIRRHLVLWSALVCFVLIHSIITEKQERFMIPMLPLLIVLGMAALYQLEQGTNLWSRARWLRRICWGVFMVVNLAALSVFTINYGKRGAVSPLVYLSHQPDADRVLIDMTERNLYVPYSYWSNDRSGAVVLRKGGDLDSLLAASALNPGDPPRYAVIYADRDLERHLAALKERLGQYEVVFHGEPSLVDVIANRLNPKYNRRNESWVVRLAPRLN